MKYQNPKNGLQITDEGFDAYPSPNRTSNCCGADMYDDSDICPDCKEHCAAEIVCPDCDGIGKVDVLDESKINSQTISPPYKSVTCETCNGIGYIEDEN